MLRIEYSLEAKFYFLDNDPYTFDLLVKIEELRYTHDGLPTDSYSVSDDLILWNVLDHTVAYRIVGDLINVRAVKPE